MKRLLSLSAIALVVLTATLLSGCGSRGGTTTPTTTPQTSSSSTGGPVDVLGTWTVPGQSASAYHLTFYPDGTYTMSYAGATYNGRYQAQEDSVTLDDPKLTLEFSRGADMTQDKLVETRDSQKIDWTRV